MAKTIELRCPFLSRPVIEASLSLPYEARTHKKILKSLFSDIIPKQIIERKKVPLKSPFFRKGGLTYRYKLVELFLKEVINEYKRCN